MDRKTSLLQSRGKKHLASLDVSCSCANSPIDMQLQVSLLSVVNMVMAIIPRIIWSPTHLLLIHVSWGTQLVSSRSRSPSPIQMAITISDWCDCWATFYLVKNEQSSQVEPGYDQAHTDIITRLYHRNQLHHSQTLTQSFLLSNFDDVW